MAGTLMRSASTSFAADLPIDAQQVLQLEDAPHRRRFQVLPHHRLDISGVASRGASPGWPSRG